MVINGKINWDKLKETVKLGIRFLDDTIIVNHYLIEEIRKNVEANRKIGLGVMGWAEMLIKLNIPYDTEKALQLGGKLMSFINKVSLETSHQLALERGVFPNWEQSSYYPDLKLRNATRTAIAPTGTISSIAGTSFSIEPLFALSYDRSNVLDNDTFREVDPLLTEYLITNQLIDPVQKESLKKMDDQELHQLLDEKGKKLFVTALNITTNYHVMHQTAFQKHTDNAVSKTINLPESASPSDVQKAFELAIRSGAKGITIYRYNSKNEQVLNLIDRTNSCKQHCNCP